MSSTSLILGVQLDFGLLDKELPTYERLNVILPFPESQDQLLVCDGAWLAADHFTLDEVCERVWRV